METPSLRKYVPLLIAGAALIVAGCSDTVAPTEEAVTSLVPIQDGSFSSIVSRTEGEGATEIRFTLTRAAGTAQVGEFTLTWQDNAVCERDNSGYGVAFWKRSCQAENEDIEMTARVWSDNGRTYVDFFPDIRFSPSKDVTLSVIRPEIVGRRLTLLTMLKYNIFYTHRVGNSRFYVDEAWTDPEQRTHFDTSSGLVWREIRHFSGFVIRTGAEEAPPTNPPAMY